MRKLSVIFLVLLVILACESNTNKPSKKKETTSRKNDTTRLSVPRLKLLDIEKAVRLKLDNESSFESIAARIDSVNIEPQVKLKSNFLLLGQDSDDLIESLPEELKNNQVMSRLNQLRTYSLLVDDDLKNKKDSLLVEQHILKILESYNSLIVQLNETDNTISEEFKKELEKAKFERDSLKQTEVAPLF